MNTKHMKKIIFALTLISLMTAGYSQARIPVNEPNTGGNTNTKPNHPPPTPHPPNTQPRPPPTNPRDTPPPNPRGGGRYD